MTTSISTRLTSKEACTLAHKIRRETGCSLSEAFKAAYNTSSAPVAPKTSWTAEELNQIFSDKAAELIAKGYTIDLAGMAGSQGEIGKIVFKKDNTFYALVMESKSSYSDGKYTDRYVIWFGKYTEDTSNMSPLNHWSTTLWLNKFEATWTMTFAKITNNYFVTEEAVKAMNEKWLERCRNGRVHRFEEVSDNYNEAILGCVRKQKGFKSTKLSDITKVTRIFETDDNYNVIGRYYHVKLTKLNKYNKPVTIDIKF